jgi:DNA-binding HxlR family transcriptional regulator
VTSVPLPSDYATQPCPLARALEIVGERWTMLILRDLFFGVHRFGELVTHMDIPRAVLAARLDGLVERGIVERRPYAAGRDEFHLTAAGRELWPVLHGLMDWGERQAPADGGPRRVFVHVACGTVLSGAGVCRACAITPDPGEVEMRLGGGRDPARRRDPVSVALRAPRRLLTPLQS